MVLLTMLAVVVILSATNRTNINPDKYSFSSHKVVSNGIPNSVVFDIDAVHSPFDSVEVQQSWDESLRTRIPKDRRQQTSIYYYPGFFEAKLVVGGEIVREHSLHITTNGWYCAIQQDPVPVYFPATDLIGDGFFELKLDQVRNMNINMHPNPPIVRMGYFADFEVLKTDNFIFETKFRNTFHEGSAACQHTRIYLLCEGSIIKIPLMVKGCSSSATLSFVNHYVSGKESDLSGFGVDFQEDVKVRIESKGGAATVLVNDQLVYTVPGKIAGIEIKGIDFRFEGLGKIDYVKLGNLNGDWILNENF